MTTLEVLYEARRRLEGEPYVFGRWASCTCGHIYTAATGRRVDPSARGDNEACDPGNGPYADALRAIAAANGLWLDPAGLGAAVSHGTVELAIKAVPYSPVTDDRLNAAAAIALVSKAISHLEAEQEKARLDVLAQAEAVVNAAKLDPVPA